MDGEGNSTAAGGEEGGREGGGEGGVRRGREGEKGRFARGEGVAVAPAMHVLSGNHGGLGGGICGYVRGSATLPPLFPAHSLAELFSCLVSIPPPHSNWIISPFGTLVSPTLFCLVSHCSKLQY